MANEQERRDLVAWLVEKTGESGAAVFLMADTVGLIWSNDANAAIRFARREDADSVCQFVEDAEFVREHRWCADRRAQAAPASTPEKNVNTQSPEYQDAAKMNAELSTIKFAHNRTLALMNWKLADTPRFTRFKCLKCGFEAPLTTEEIARHRLSTKCDGTTVGAVATPDTPAPTIGIDVGDEDGDVTKVVCPNCDCVIEIESAASPPPAVTGETPAPSIPDRGEPRDAIREWLWHEQDNSTRDFAHLIETYHEDLTDLIVDAVARFRAVPPPAETQGKE